MKQMMNDDRGEIGVARLRGLDVVRARPLLYISATNGRGIADLVSFVLRYSFGQDADWGGKATVACVTLLRAGGVRVEDNSTGLSTGFPAEVQHSLAPLFAEISTDRSSVSSLYIVNAFSDRITVSVARDGYWWQQVFVDDIEDTDLRRMGQAAGPGLRVDFWPRVDVFGADVDAESIVKALEDLRVAVPSASVAFVDARECLT